jgi:hypothetical protein
VKQGYIKMKSHLSEVNMSYTEHAIRSTRFSVLCARLAIACAIHAVIPSLFKTTYSDTITRRYIELMEE